MVRGWVLGKRSPAHTVVVKYGAETILTTPVKLRRPVVAQTVSRYSPGKRQRL